MTRKRISTGSQFETTAGYSRAVIQDNWCFVSGTTGYDYSTMELPDSLEAQLANVFATIDATLKQAGFLRSDVIRVVYYVADRNLVELVFPLAGVYFSGIQPAATMVICDLIEPAMKIEIEITALKARISTESEPALLT
uniref:RidA family protein n=1 Tax=Pararhizobium sp. IMCC3301 TaxID=3067904 RepID=UPI0027424A58|nr:RidA family protein [Pararhizobium sp. IMCC3301]